MSERCKATHVVQCERTLLEHLGEFHVHDELEWDDGDPQPRIEITPEQRDKKADAARIEHLNCDQGQPWSVLDEFIRNRWRRSVIAVLESDGDKVEIIEPGPEIPDEALCGAIEAIKQLNPSPWPTLSKYNLRYVLKAMEEGQA